MGRLVLGRPGPVTHKEERGKKREKGPLNIVATAGLRTQSAPVFTVSYLILIHL